jgi:hypothetical protein
MTAVSARSQGSGDGRIAASARGPQHRRAGLFAVVNALTTGGAFLGLMLHSNAQAGLFAYVALLGLACSAPLLFIRSLHGRGALLLAFQGIFFALFGLADWAALMTGAAPARAPGALLSGGEIAILLTSLLFSAGYAAALGIAPEQVRGWMSRDWSPRAIAVMGVVFWLIGFTLNAMFMSGVDLARATTTGFAAFGALAGVAVLLAYLMPIGDMCMIYLYLTQRRGWALHVLGIMLACEFTLGFLASAKELAFRGIVLFIISVPFLRGRIPLKGVVAYVLLAGLTFSFFEDMRTQVARRGVDFGATAQRLAESPNRTFGADNAVQTRFERGIDYFASRGNLKGSVELVVARAGLDVPFQNGYTIGILRYAFVPRFLAPDKPDSTIGLLFNDEFDVSAVSTVYVAAGQNGELYWNYGWSGLVVGMLIAGALMGYTNTRLDLSRSLTLPRFVLLLLTVYLLAFRFEASIAQQYTLWLRAIALLAAIHLCMPKARPP